MACVPRAPPPEGVLRLGHFPNVTHAQGLIAHQLSRRGEGWFEGRLGVQVQWYVFHAGPSAMEALLAGSLDAVYVGPNPALNAHLRSGGEEVRVVALACRGGSALVVREAAAIEKPSDLRGRRVATPQLGNTQDVACRAWLKAQGLEATLTGGEVQVLPTPNPELLGLFLGAQLDAAWTVEPWVSVLEREGGGRVLLEDDALTTVLAASRALVEGRADLAHRLVEAHAGLTGWVLEHPEEARALVAAELESITRRPAGVETLEGAWPRLHLGAEVEVASFEGLLRDARDVGLVPDDLPPDAVARLVVRP